jgi:twitching motility protein PilT
MSQLDKLIERLQPQQEILLETGKEPMMRTEAGTKIMVNQKLMTPQVIALLTEIATSPHKENIAAKRQTNFQYTYNSKSYSVTFMTQGDQVRSVISIAEAGEAAPAAPEEDEIEVIQDSPVEAEEQTARPAAAAAAPARPKAAGGKEPEINGLLRKMFGMNASDLHLTSNHKPMIRLHGDMMELSADHPVITADRMKKLLGAITPEHNQTQFEETHDTDFAHEIEGLARFRVNFFMDRFGMGAVFRQIPMEIVTAEKLGLSKDVLNLCFLSKGLVLVTGPTGSGKSTTLCALVDYINRHRKDHIITIEDPIEFVHEKKNCLINQREVHVHTESFSNALRAALREDPDIVLVGEMRDLETISIAIETAETGHLVFGTLHTSTAASTVDRIIDQFPADRQAQIRTMLSSSLKGVISQTLCKKLTKGRTAALEILFVNSAVSNLIREGKIFQIPSIMQTAKGQGMTLLNDALFKLVVDKQVAPEEAYIKAIDKLGFVTMLKSKAITLNLTGSSVFD